MKIENTKDIYKLLINELDKRFPYGWSLEDFNTETIEETERGYTCYICIIPHNKITNQPT